MRVTIVNYVCPKVEDATAALDELRALTGWAEAIHQAGAEVTVFQGFDHDASLERAGVRYEMVAVAGVRSLRGWQIPRRLHRVAAQLPADVLHVNGLLFALQARDLRRRLPSDTCLVMQHHAETPRQGIAGAVESWALRVADGFFFTGSITAAPWRLRVATSQPFFDIMEGSSRFRLPAQGREQARLQSGMNGSPVLFWAGNLDANKDPLTALEGFETLLDDFPEARFYLAFRGGALLDRVRARIDSSAKLRGSVTLLGRISYPEIEIYFQSADLFVQGSHHEGSGFALADAMACGLFPVVTNIPSFRYMTDEGANAELWPPGDAAELAAALRRGAARDLSTVSFEIRDFFDRQLSWPAIGARAVDAYGQLSAQKGRGAGRRNLRRREGGAEAP